MPPAVAVQAAPPTVPITASAALEAALWNAHGHRVLLRDYLAQGPLAVVVTNRALDPVRSRLTAGCWRLMAEVFLAGGNVVAVSPGGGADFVSSEEQLRLPVDVLTDPSGAVARALGAPPSDVPTIHLLSPDGRVVATRGVGGETEAATLDEFFDTIRSLARAAE